MELPKDIVVPHNLDAEQVLLGALLNNNERIYEILDMLKSSYFYMPFHGKLYDMISRFVDKGIVATPVTLKNYFDLDVESELGCSAFDYMKKLGSGAILVSDVVPFAKEICDTAMKRELISLAQGMVTDSLNRSIDPISQIEGLESSLFSIVSSGSYKRDFRSVGSLFDGMIEKMQDKKKRNTIDGIFSGYIDLDNLLMGMQNSDLIVLAARPSMGKTSLAVNIGLNAASPKNKNGGPVAFFSLEMSAEQIATRLLSIKSSVDSSKIRSGKVSEEESTAIILHSKDLAEVKMFIDDTPALTISSLMARARRLKRKEGIRLIIVDYLQLLHPTHRMDNRVQEIAEISRGLKALAKELNIPVIALSQLSRAVEAREDKRPFLSDLRESGNIEQDADVVMFIYREEYYLRRKEPGDKTGDQYKDWVEKLRSSINKADIIVAKHRNGPVGSVTLHFDSHSTTFANLLDDETISYVH